MGIITDIFLPLALAFIMFSLGLGLTGTAFTRVIKQPKDFFVGLSCQIILLPVIALILAKLLPITPELAVGLMIIAAAPGGVTSNILTSFARGDVALSISLTAIISLLSVITVPFIVITSLGLFGLENISKDSSTYLEVKRGNFPAIKLYLNAGFKDIAIREDYYPDGEDAIVM